MRSFVEH